MGAETTGDAFSFVDSRESQNIRARRTGSKNPGRSDHGCAPVLTDAIGDRTDEELIELTADGNREALSILFRRYSVMVRSVASRILSSGAEADDLVQEVFLFLLRKAALFDPTRGSARSWLVQVTYHRAFDRRRYLNSRHFYSNVNLDEGMSPAGEGSFFPVPYEKSIEGILGRTTLGRIEASLTNVQRVVMRLYFSDGHNFQAIAEILGQSVGNVRNHYYRSLEKMRKAVFAGDGKKVHPHQEM